MKRILKGTLKTITVITVIYVVIVTTLIALSPKLIPIKEDEDFDASDFDY